MSTSAVGGRREFDLTVDRSTEDDFELVQIPNARTINVESSDSEAFLHFGSKQADGFSTNEYTKFTFMRGPPAALYLENGSGAAGTLTLTFGVDMDPETDLVIDSVDSINSTVTVDLTDDQSREAGKVRVQDSGGTLIDPASDGTLSNVLGALSNESNLSYGQTSISSSGTAESINGGGSEAVPDGMAVLVQALPDNSGNVYIGDSSVGTGSGYPLQAGQTVSLSVDDISTIFADVDSDGDGVAYVTEVA